MAIPLYWWRKKPNFGDRLSPLIVSYLAGQDAVFTKKPCKLVAVGSVLHFACEGDHLWGTGLRGPCPAAKHLVVHAVRGPKTREFLLNNGIECPPVYGDPALLMPLIYRPSIVPWREIAILPHYSDRHLQMAASASGFHVIQATCPPLEVIDDILASKILITSALHGLIIAEAYGIPVVLLRDSNQTWEPHFKFEDYYSSTGRDDQTVWNISIDHAIRHLDKIIPPIPINREQLIQAFPKTVFNKEVKT